MNQLAFKSEAKYYKISKMCESKFFTCTAFMFSYGLLRFSKMMPYLWPFVGVGTFLGYKAENHFRWKYEILNFRTANRYLDHLTDHQLEVLANLKRGHLV